MNENVDLSKLHKSTLECNLSYWRAKEEQLAEELRVAFYKQVELHNELLKRKENTNDN